jgi:ribosome recycling factor
MATELLIRTDSLRKILEEEPDVKLKLQNMAIEKIAEELKKKAQHISLERFEQEMKSTINKAIAEANQNLTSKYKFPAEAKAIIEELAKEAVTKHWKFEASRWETSITEFFAAKQVESDKLTEAKVFESIEKMRPVIAQQARQEFISVLEAARGVTA